MHREFYPPPALDIRRVADAGLEVERPGAALVAAPEKPGDVAGRGVFLIAEIPGALVDLVTGEIAHHALDD